MTDYPNLELDFLPEADDASGRHRDATARIYLSLACGYLQGAGQPTMTADCTSFEDFEREIGRLKNECGAILADAAARFAASRQPSAPAASEAAITASAGPLATPVFSTAARVAAPPPADDWRAGALRALYEIKEYRLAMTQAWLTAANDAAPEERAALAGTAGEHARTALAEGPASGYGWLMLAWTEYLTGHDDRARDALAASWRWTPHSRSLSLSRALLESRWWPELSSGERERLLDELLRASRGHRAAFAVERARDARIAALWRLASARERTRRALERASN